MCNSLLNLARQGITERLRELLGLKGIIRSFAESLHTAIRSEYVIQKDFFFCVLRDT
jgi:hypothetical protein